MPPKTKIPAPIDRPLSRAYLREFTGWSTAYPPGLSDPASLRLMENVWVAKDGSCKVRPGLRYFSYETAPDGDTPGVACTLPLVGTHELFYLSGGDKAYLFAVREETGEVTFRLLVFEAGVPVVRELDDYFLNYAANPMSFTEATTYVKYLQIDNKIFALSNAGEPMLLFFVDTTPSAKALEPILRPNWDVPDKLTVVQPDDAWVINPSAVRTNLVKDPQFTSMATWYDQGITFRGEFTKATVSNTEFQAGSTSMKIESRPTKENFVIKPLHDVATTGITGWTPSNSDAGPFSISASGTYLQLNFGAGNYNNWEGAYLDCPISTDDFRADADIWNNYVRLAYDWEGDGKVDPEFWLEYYDANNTYLYDGYWERPADHGAGSGRQVSGAIWVPPEAAYIRVYVGGRCWDAGACTYRIKNVVLVKDGISTAMFHGGSGANYFWDGSANDSRSVYHPPVEAFVWSHRISTTAGQQYHLSQYIKASSGGMTLEQLLRYYSASDAAIMGEDSASDAVTTSWVRQDLASTSDVGSNGVYIRYRVPSLARGEAVYVDAVLYEKSATLQDYFDGDTPDDSSNLYDWTGADNNSTSTHTEFTAALDIPGAETPTGDTLISNDPLENIYSVGLWYAFTNEVGDSAFSQVTIKRVQRSWSSWRWTTSGGADTQYPELCLDQLVGYMPEDVFDHAIANGAISWSMYAITWSDQAPVPVVGVKVAEVALGPDSDYESKGWARMTPLATAYSDNAVVPSLASLYNYSDPHECGQGLVASDRMILVKDPTDSAVIRWTTNDQGRYTDFSAHKGGGYKTLTSGNLFLTACVKLWQNPQSVDTLTILCAGDDGHSTSYYMAPAEITSQSDSTPIMGFEESTATPGTTSPYGCEVFNNSLFHPVEDQLIKTTASNYNINHASLTDQIENKWIGLNNKARIVSCQLEKRLYYLVDNPDGEQTREGNLGNEIWVYDAEKKAGTWSRWLIQGCSLRKIGIGGKIYMSVIAADGLYYLDPEADTDAYVDDDGNVQYRNIPWAIETNIQGANRAHDAWCMLQKLEINLGNFHGTMKWGIRSWDKNGKDVEISKITRDLRSLVPDVGAPTMSMPFDIEDHLQIKRELQQWYLFASSVLDEDEETVLNSFGSINNVQYRYLPISVNVGYEYGSVETFEYARATENWGQRTTDNGVPIPMIDTRRP